MHTIPSSTLMLRSSAMRFELAIRARGGRDHSGSFRLENFRLMEEFCFVTIFDLENHPRLQATCSLCKCYY